MASTSRAFSLASAVPSRAKSNAAKRCARAGAAPAGKPRGMRGSTTGAPRHAGVETMNDDVGVPSGVSMARKTRRGTVVAQVGDIPPGMPRFQEDPKGFWEIFFGKNPNKGKIHAQLKHRALSLMPYLIPCMGAIAFTGEAFMAYPVCINIALAISPLLQIFYSNSFIPFVTFFTLFLTVVRNTTMPHFVRYNTMQAILLDICVMLAGLIMQYLPMYITTSFIGDILELGTLTNALLAIGYCMWNVIQGIYPEIPIITEAVYAQVRDQ